MAHMLDTIRDEHHRGTISPNGTPCLRKRRILKHVCHCWRCRVCALEDRNGQNPPHLAKAFSFQLIGLVTMTGLGTIFTGSASVPGGMVLTSAALGTLCYIGHEKLWACIAWGRHPESRALIRPRTSPMAKTRSRAGNAGSH
jgi:uncharacterized membrane protein